jgi:peptide-methionine (R)-S-oxide reductase
MTTSAAAETDSVESEIELPGGHVSDYEIQRTDEEWQSQLGPERYAILRQAATERPFTGKLLHVDDDGSFSCAGCGTVLFDTHAKFDSGSGWPSFDSAVGPIVERRDASHGMVRTEVVCGTCGGHLGHLFNDGPATTGLRYCINSASLEFEPAEEGSEEG